MCHFFFIRINFQNNFMIFLDKRIKFNKILKRCNSLSILAYPTYLVGNSCILLWSTINLHIVMESK